MKSNQKKTVTTVTWGNAPWNRYVFTRTAHNGELTLPAFMTEEEIKDLVEDCTWEPAKTMPQYPHEYTRIEATVPQNRIPDYKRFIKHIHDYGYDAYFWKLKLRYFDFEGRCYWYMDKDYRVVGLVNRSKLPNIATHLPGPPKRPAMTAKQDFELMKKKFRDDS